MTPEDVEVICATIRQWPNGRITWNAIAASVAETLGHRWTRQALERHPEIKDAFQARKATGRIAPPKPVDPAETLLRDRIDRLTRQVAELQQRVGIARASRLWEAFADDLYRVLGDGDVAALAEVIGEDLARALVAAWAENLAEADVVVWLDEHGFDARLANRIIRFWGADAVRKLRANPYVMMAFASWEAVDRAARKLGFGTDHPFRQVAAVEAVLYRRLDQRHTWTAADAVVRGTARLLGASLAVAEQAVRLGLRASTLSMPISID